MSTCRKLLCSPRRRSRTFVAICFAYGALFSAAIAAEQTDRLDAIYHLPAKRERIKRLQKAFERVNPEPRSAPRDIARCRGLFAEIRANLPTSLIEPDLIVQNYDELAQVLNFADCGDKKLNYNWQAPFSREDFLSLRPKNQALLKPFVARRNFSIYELKGLATQDAAPNMAVRPVVLFSAEQSCQIANPRACITPLFLPFDPNSCRVGDGYWAADRYSSFSDRIKADMDGVVKIDKRYFAVTMTTEQSLHDFDQGKPSQIILNLNEVVPPPQPKKAQCSFFAQ